MHEIKRKRNTCVRWPTFVFFILLLPRMQSQEMPDSRWGTCAIFLSNDGNLALVIDSALTTAIGDVRVKSGELTCKVWLPAPTIVAATSGLFSAGPFITGWNANFTGRRWLKTLPKNPTESQVDVALRGWGQQLINFSVRNPKAIQSNDGEVASLIVAFKSNGTPYFFRERIVRYRGEVIRDDADSIRQPLEAVHSTIFYSGSCRNFVAVHGHRTVEVTDSEAASLSRIGIEARSGDISSAQHLGDIAMKLELQLSKINKEHASDIVALDDIGPPYQQAILPKDSTEWITKFTDPCK